MKTLLVVLILSLFLIRVSTMSFGPGTQHNGKTFKADGAIYNPPEPEIKTESEVRGSLTRNDPFARFVSRFFITRGPR